MKKDKSKNDNTIKEEKTKVKKEKKVKEKKVKEKKIKDKKDKVKLGEKISLNLKRKWLVNRTKTFLIMAILFVGYIALNVSLRFWDIPTIDVTENQIYTLSDASKKAIENIDQEIKIYVYGFEEDSNVMKFLKQYSKVNDKISFEILTEETNMQKVKENELAEGYHVLIMESGDSKKYIDASESFSTFDYTTYQTVDTTEQSITNSILALTEEHKPKIYFTTGHGEYASSLISVVSTYLTNESFLSDTLNIATQTEIPEDCDILAFLSPTKDLLDVEVEIIKNYINKGGNIFFSRDVLSQDTAFTNFDTILDIYGVSVQNGYILEYDTSKGRSDYPYVFMPTVSNTNPITADIYTDSAMWLAHSAKLNFKSDDELISSNIQKEILAYSSDDTIFVTDLSTDMTTAAQTAETGKADIAALMTKNIPTTNSEGEEETIDSKLVIVANGLFFTDYIVQELTSNSPMSYIGANKDFIINSFSYLGEKGNSITIRKDMKNSTYMPTERQNAIVMTIITTVPIIIMMIGATVAVYRKKRK